MPIPKPKKGESEKDFISRCVSKLADEEPKMPNSQRVAICYDAWRKKGETMIFDKLKNIKEHLDDFKRDEDGNIIVAENVNVVFGSELSFVKEQSDDEEDLDDDDEDLEMLEKIKQEKVIKNE